MKTITITPKQEWIDQDDHCTDTCPLARCLTEALGVPVWVGIRHWGITGKAYESTEQMKDWLKRYDTNMFVEPETFTLEVPE